MRAADEGDLRLQAVAGLPLDLVPNFRDQLPHVGRRGAPAVDDDVGVER